MTTNEESSSGALLLAEGVRRDEREPRRLIGSVRVGGHPVRVVLDFTRWDMGLVEYVEMPWLLGSHPPSQRAVVRLMSRVYDGEAFDFPRDLSEEVRGSSPPSPFEPMEEERRAALEAEAGSVRLEVLEAVRDASEPSRLAAKVRLEGGAREFEVELYAGPGRVPVLRWLRGASPESLSAAERYAVLRALLGEDS